MIKDPIKRLGSNGAEEIKKHQFFNGINFKEIMQR